MTADLVEGQRRTVLIGIHDLSKRYETQLDQSLESVADAGSQSASAVQKIRDRFCDRRISEERGNEFAGAVRFVAA